MTSTNFSGSYFNNLEKYGEKLCEWVVLHDLYIYLIGHGLLSVLQSFSSAFSILKANRGEAVSEQQY